jgi:hypothetical protein
MSLPIRGRNATVAFSNCAEPALNPREDVLLGQFFAGAVDCGA